MRKALPEKIFADVEQARLTALRKWVLENSVTEIQMSEHQFWNSVTLQPPAEKPWATYMGRTLHVPDMPNEAQVRLGIEKKQRIGVI